MGGIAGYPLIGTGNSDLYGGWSYDGDPRAYFNRPDPPEYPECAKDPERGNWLCPYCDADDCPGRPIPWEER